MFTRGHASKPGQLSWQWRAVLWLCPCLIEGERSSQKMQKNFERAQVFRAWQKRPERQEKKELLNCIEIEFYILIVFPFFFVHICLGRSGWSAEVYSVHVIHNTHARTLAHAHSHTHTHPHTQAHTHTHPAFPQVCGT